MSLKKERKVISLDDKLKIIQRKRDGEKATKIALSMGLAPTTVRSICNRDFEKIQDFAQNVSPSYSKNVTRYRQPIIEQMEAQLIIWIQYKNQTSHPLSQSIITHKARSLFENLKKAACNSPETSSVNFEASRGWFYRFKARAQITADGSAKVNQVKLEKPVERLDWKQNISKGLKLLEEAKAIIRQNDPDETRSVQVLLKLKEATKCYINISQKNQKYLIQTKIDSFFLPDK